MRRRKRPTAEEEAGPYIPRRICIGWIVSTEFIERVQPFWRPELLSTDLARVVCGWCYDHYQKYKAAPLSDIEAVFRDHKDHLDPVSVDQIELMLESLSDQYEQTGETLNVEYLVDQTKKYLREQAHRQRSEEYSTLIERGEIDKAEALIETPLPSFDGDAVKEVRTLSEYEHRAIEWLAKDMIPRGYLTLLAGPKNAGKTLFVEWVAARCSRSAKWGFLKGRARGHTMLMTVEDDAGDMIGPRVRAAGGDDQRIHIVEGIATVDDDGSPVVDLWNVKNLTKLERWLDQYPRVRLVVVDPVGDFMPDQKRGMTSAYQHVRRSLSPLAKLAARRRIAIVLTTHLRKGHEGSMLDKIIDSTGFTTLCRMVLAMAPHPDYDPAMPYKGVLAVAATNLVRRPWPSFEYRIDSLEVDPKIGEQPLIVIEGASTVTAEELMSRPKSSEERSAQEELREWLLEELESGPVPSRELFERGKRFGGYSEDQIRRAAHKLSAKAKPQGQGEPWAWTLPAGKGKSRKS
ncbi:MAG TPA: AAA family ATPase [Gammaproteobacteria bacterium]|nr:AAA family ATPase [Gammaproteobacteria bacterium]